MVKEFEALINLINLAVYGTDIPKERLIEYDWEKVLEEARVHNCWAIVFPAVKIVQEKYKLIDMELYTRWRDTSIFLATKQCAKNYELGHVIKLLERHNISPTVFKGVTVAKLYPEYLLRVSGDADILIDESDMKKASEILLEDGYEIDEKSSKPYVPVFVKKDMLVIELHLSLWEGRSDDEVALLEGMNLTDKTSRHRFYGCDLECDTLGYTEHLVYIIYHMIKHLIPGGIGIRHLLDMTLYINTYYDKLDVGRLYTCINKLGFGKVCYSIFKICINYLNMTNKILLGKSSNITDLENELLNDIRDAGVFGGRTLERIKASNVVKATYYEQDSNRKDISKFRIFLNTAFPSADALSDRYVDARKHKILLPIAWCQRIVFHFKQKKVNKYEPNVFEKANAVEKRITLLKRLGLVNNMSASRSSSSTS